VTAHTIDGRTRADEIRADVAARAEAFAQRQGRSPGLAAVLVGGDPAGEAYAQAKGRAAARAGIAYRIVSLPEDSDTTAVVAAVRALNGDPAIDGILVELPLPEPCDRLAVQAGLDPARDVDGVTPDSQARWLTGSPGPRPATALAVMDLIAQVGVPLAGSRAVVVGRSPVVGLPAAMLLLAAHATVTIAHSRTRDLAAVTREADVLVVAAGVPRLIGVAHVRPGAVVIDVGTNVIDAADGQRMVGDVDPAVRDVAAALTPVPGGVGPVTTAMVLRATMDLAERRAAGRPARR
jgi:methylenetetrahydrofolate dehydrogenase (NADP+) / methenyltetrahydrofolate cyclohydrolase